MSLENKHGPLGNKLMANVLEVTDSLYLSLSNLIHSEYRLRWWYNKFVIFSATTLLHSNFVAPTSILYILICTH